MTTCNILRLQNNMKAHQLISALDEARFGRRLTEDGKPVADSPSHAPTSTAQWKTKGTGKSSDEGERMGGEKDAIKKSETAIPAPVAKEPSHAPTSTAQWKTKGGEGKSEDEGEKISKEAMKENLLDQLINGEEADIEAIMAEAEISEGGHKPGCQCGFCKNKGKMGKKSDDEGEKADDDKDDMTEGHMPMRRPMGRPGAPGAGGGMPIKRRLGGERMGFRHPSAASPRPKAAINPYQPAMERLDKSGSPRKTIQEMADELLESPGTE